MSADPAHQFALSQLGDSEAAVPVSSTEQQTAIVGHHQHLGTEIHPWGEETAEEPLGSVGGRRESQERRLSKPSNDLQ